MSLAYQGGELEIFAAANNWKQYLAGLVSLTGVHSVLEVGAGLGGTTRALCDGTQATWVCLEPDRSLAEKIGSAKANHELPSVCTVRIGTIEALADNEAFDAILYIDVLEHIADDARELGRAARHLRPGGRLIVLSPAHQWLYSPFDKAIGHFRRYSRATLAAAVPAGLRCESLVYLDSLGMLLSFANRLLLRRAVPSIKQVTFWDTRIIPLSKVADGWFRYRLGKSVLGIWRAG